MPTRQMKAGGRSEASTGTCTPTVVKTLPHKTSSRRWQPELQLIIPPAPQEVSSAGVPAPGIPALWPGPLSQQVFDREERRDPASGEGTGGLGVGGGGCVGQRPCFLALSPPARFDFSQ